MSEEANAAVAAMMQGRLVAEATATRILGEDALGEDANIAAAQNLGDDASGAAADNLGKDAKVAASKGKAERTEVMSTSQENKIEKTNEGDDQSRRLIEERRNTVKGETTIERIEHQDQKVHQRQNKDETTRKDTADSG